MRQVNAALRGRFWAVLVVLVVAASCGGDRGEPRAAEAAVMLLDTVPLFEPDTAVIGRPVSFAHMRNGEWWVLDRFSASIVRFGPDGTFRGRVGRRGRGPGEFESPMRFVELDSLVAVVDSRLRRVSFFSPRGDYSDSAFTIPFTPGDVALGGGLLWITNASGTDTAVWTWDTRTGVSRAFGEFPALWRENRFAAALGGPLVIPSEDLSPVTTGFGGIGYLFRVDPRTGQTRDSIAIPRSVRRGVPDDVTEVLSTPTAFEDVSILYKLHRLPGRQLAVSHLDVTQQGAVFGGEYFLTILTDDGTPIATDVKVPDLTADAIPATFVSGDTLHVLVQPVDALGVRSVIRRYILPNVVGRL